MTTTPGILGPISYIDCLVFVALLVPQLILQAGLVETARCGLKMLPFLVYTLPVSFVKERFLTRPPAERSPFVRKSTAFEDLVVRCVRYAFAHVPPVIARVFFSSRVAMPFWHWRYFRHGFWRGAVFPWREVENDRIKAILIIKDPARRPDLVIYYAHGGGFVMGSSYFYFEFFQTWLSLLSMTGQYKNPAIFALEYTLVPDAVFPTQFEQALHGYQQVLAMVDSSSRVCFAGDSAGANVILSLLLRLPIGYRLRDTGRLVDKLPAPGMVVLISPWTELLSPKHRGNAVDYVDADALHRYGRMYAGKDALVDGCMVSPGSCRSEERWRNAMPKDSGGIFVAYGGQEVFAPEIEHLVGFLRDVGLSAETHKEPAAVHAWPVASLFVSSTEERRLAGIRAATRQIAKRMPPAEMKNGFGADEGNLQA